MKFSFKQNFQKIHINKYEFTIYSILLLSLVLGFVFQWINYFFTHYTGVVYATPYALLLIAFYISIVIAGHFIKPSFPLGFLILFTYLITVLELPINLLLIDGAQYTPFPLVDKYLLAADQFLHFSTTKILNWTFQYNNLVLLLRACYDFVVYQLLIIPFILAFLRKEKAVYCFFILSQLSTLVTVLFYYFFPATGPYLLLHDAHFPHMGSVVVKLFEEIHNFLKPTFHTAGIISFPSLHILWVFTVIYVARAVKLLFWPVFIINMLGFAATLLLGWHYLVDDLASIVIFFGFFLPFIYLLDLTIKYDNKLYFGFF